ncbi:Metallo-dependent phosphatase [Sporormia fimetaria CBS 119925]|uniref:Metallo-dependent phosphatase n=1 Tax=Sporormia fimetaria CBS 119925 TaxID=1340428 RepID=A0A6A6VF85_9PLEO|nr:Metallo-dependent phosphatase [Sporormia fimetaria CBS 119925]
MSTSSSDRIKTRILIISDTHDASPVPSGSSPCDVPFRSPLPSADVLLHCGDLTMVGLMDEYEGALAMLSSIDARLKLVIAGNHDISLDAQYYARKGQTMQSLKEPDTTLPARAKELWTGERAKQAGVTYLEEGTYSFVLDNGAKLRVYASPYQPEFCDWAFSYEVFENCFNPPHIMRPTAKNPVPDFPHIDVMMTHGPPGGILDKACSGEHVGCPFLLLAARRCKPKIHCFGHIHEGWGAKRVVWKDDLDVRSNDHVQAAEDIEVDNREMTEKRAATVDISQDGGQPLKWGEETLMLNASIMNFQYQPRQGPWLVDVDLDRA